MIRYRKYIIFSVALLTTVFTYGQKSAKVVVAGTTGGNKILVKWFSKQFLYPDGVHVYRKRTADPTWTKLTQAPIKKGDYLLTEADKKDEQIKGFTGFMDGEMTDMTKALTIYKCFESNSLSRYAGIMYEDESATAGANYQYKITEVKDGQEIELGVSASINPAADLDLSPPQEIAHRDKKSLIELKWLREDLRFYGVNVYRKSSKEPTYKQMTKKPVIVSKIQNSAGEKVWPKYFYTETGLEKKVNYTWYVTALDFFGHESDASKELHHGVIDYDPPSAAEKVHAEPSSHNEKKVRLTWEIEPSENLSGFNVYRHSRDDTNFVKVNQVEIDRAATSYEDNVPKHDAYYYYVAAANFSGVESKSSIAYAEVRDLIPPAPPTGLTVKTDTGRLILKWNANSEEDLAGYLIYRGIEGSSESYVLMHPDAVTESTFTDKIDKKTKNKFVYVVRAMDHSMNKSEISNIGGGKMPDVTPPVKPFIQSVKSLNKSLQVKWAKNVEPDLTGYNLYRKLDGEENYSVIEKSISPELTTYMDNNIAAGTNYFYALRAFDQDNNESQNSNEILGRLSTAKVVSAAPELRKVNVSYNKKKKVVDISWRDEDQTDYMGAVVYRRSDNAPMGAISGLLKAETFKDRDIKKGKTYWYEVRAYHSSGTKTRSKQIETTIPNAETE